MEGGISRMFIPRWADKNICLSVSDFGWLLWKKIVFYDSRMYDVCACMIFMDKMLRWLGPCCAFTHHVCFAVNKPGPSPAYYRCFCPRGFSFSRNFFEITRIVVKFSLDFLDFHSVLVFFVFLLQKVNRGYGHGIFWHISCQKPLQRALHNKRKGFRNWTKNCWFN